MRSAFVLSNFAIAVQRSSRHRNGADSNLDKASGRVDSKRCVRRAQAPQAEN